MSNAAAAVATLPPRREPSPLRTRLARAFWSGLDAATIPLSTLLLTAGLLRLLGVEDYGIFVVAFAVSNLAMATNIAITTTTMKLVSEAQGTATAAKEALGRRIAALLAVVALISGGLVLGAFIFRHELAALVYGPELLTARPDATTILTIAVLTVSLQQIDGVLAAILKGLEQFRLQSLVELGSRTALTVGMIGAAWLTHDTVIVVLLYAALLLAASILRGMAVWRAAGVRWSSFRPGWHELRRIVSFGGWMWIFAMAALLYSNIDRVLIGRHLGSAPAAEYNVYLQLAQVVQFVPAGLFAFAMPAFSRLAAQGNAAAIARNFWRLTAATALVTTLVAAALTLGFELALEVLGGTAVAHPDAHAKLGLVASFAMSAMTIPPVLLLLGLGQSKTISLLNSACALAMLAIVALAIPAYGVDGAVAGRLSYAVGSLAVYVIARRSLKSLRAAAEAAS